MTTFYPLKLNTRDKNVVLGTNSGQGFLLC